MDDTTLQANVQIGGEARYVLENPLFQRAFQACKDDLLRQMGEVKPRDTEMHTALIMHLQTLHSIERYLRNAIITGKNAEVEVQRKSWFEQMKKRVPSRFIR